MLAERLDTNQLTRQQLEYLQRSLQDCCCLWSYNKQTWVGLQAEPAVADDPKLAVALGQVQGVYLVQLQTTATEEASTGAYVPGIQQLFRNMLLY